MNSSENRKVDSYICDENEENNERLEEEPLKPTENNINSQRKYSSSSSSTSSFCDVNLETDLLIPGKKVIEQKEEEEEENINSESKEKNNPFEFNLSSTKNPLQIPLKHVLSKGIKKVNLQILDMVLSLSTISPCEYEYLTKDKRTPENDDDWKEHRSNLVHNLKSNAYDFIYLNVPSKISRYELSSENELKMSNLIVLTPKTVSETRITCPEGEFSNHKIIYS